MFLRSAALACAAATMFTLAAPANADTHATSASASARCEETTFRVYFERNSTTLSPMAMETVATAARNVSGCGYKEMHVSVDASSRLAAARGGAVLNAVRGVTWNVAQVEPRTVTRISAGPAFAEVTMTPNVMPPAEPLRAGAHTGV